MKSTSLQVRLATIASAGLLMTSFSVANANGLGENVAWQFQTTADMANRAFIEDMRQKKKNGAYAPPVYNTFIDRQYNCDVMATATGNDSYSNAIGNSPSTSGHSASAVGNSNTSSADLAGIGADSSISDELLNDGRIRARSRGDIESEVEGDTTQALNTEQDNSGDQAATVNGSSACQFGLLN